MSKQQDAHLEDLFKRGDLDSLSRELQRRGFGVGPDQHTLTLRGLPRGAQVHIVGPEGSFWEWEVEGAEDEVWRYNPELTGREVWVAISHIHYRWTQIEAVCFPGQVIQVHMELDRR